MQWFTGSAWSSAGASPFPPWRAAFIIRLVSVLVAVSLPLKIRIWDADRIMLLKMDRSLPMRKEWISFLLCNAPDPAYENGLNPFSFWKWTGSCLWEWIESRFCLALEMDRGPVCMRMNWSRTRLWKMYHIRTDPVFENEPDPAYENGSNPVSALKNGPGSCLYDNELDSHSSLEMDHDNTDHAFEKWAGSIADKNII